MASMRPLFASVRAHGPQLLAQAQDPAAELLALVWGPRFDREHAHDLLRGAAPAAAAAGAALLCAADHFDRLPAARQQRLRELIRRHAGGTIGA
jgi:hypothetical protein